MQNLLATIHAIHQIADAAFAQASIGSGLTARQAQLLEAIETSQGKSQTDLVDRTGIDRSTLAAMIARLVKVGLVSRRRSQADARAYEVHLTAKGATAVRSACWAMARAEVALRKRVLGVEGLVVLPDASGDLSARSHRSM